MEWPDRLELVLAPARILNRNCNGLDLNNMPPQRIVDQMREIMANKGIGLAAPQVGLNSRFFVTEDKVFVNPRIKGYSKEKAMMLEGCLSIPNVRVPVPRSVEIDVYYLDINGEPHNETLRDLPARVFQHEFDHLSGLLITQAFADQFNFHA